MESNGLDGFTEDEIDVAKALLDLEDAHDKTWYFKWARRGKRSALNEPAPPSIQQPEKPIGGGACEKLVSEPLARASDSPVTPFEFAGVTAVSDEKDKPRPAKVAKMTTKKDCVEKIEELTKTKQVLIGEIENVRKHRDKLLAYNSELKAKKEEVLNKKREEPQSGINLALELSQYYQTPMVMPHHYQPYIPDPTAQTFHYSIGPQAQHYSYNNELGPSNSVGPRDFDLNLPPEPEEAFGAAAAMEIETEQPQPSDQTMEVADRRARCADARRRRKGMMKIKNMRSACGIKLPTDEP